MVDLGSSLAALCRAGDLVILDGPLGAGKTTFTRGFGRGLGVRGTVTSPTFAIAQVHRTQGDTADLVHVDAYRLESLDDVDSLDLDASLEDSITVVEWGLGRVEHLTDSYLVIHLDRSSVAADASLDDVRSVQWSVVGDGWSDRLVGLRDLLGTPAT